MDYKIGLFDPLKITIFYFSAWFQMTNQGFDDIPHITKPRIPESFWITFFHFPAWNQNTNFSLSETSRITFFIFFHSPQITNPEKRIGEQITFSSHSQHTKNHGVDMK